MVKGILGYGRYDDAPEYVACPRAKSDMTPCVARDGYLSESDDGLCISCQKRPADLLQELVHEVTAPLLKADTDGT